MTQPEVSAFTPCLLSSQLKFNMSKIKLILITAIFFSPVACVLAPRVPVDSLPSELEPSETGPTHLFPKCSLCFLLLARHLFHCFLVTTPTAKVSSMAFLIQFILGRVMAPGIPLFKNLQGSLLTAAVISNSSLYFNKISLGIKESRVPPAGGVGAGSHQLPSGPHLPRWATARPLQGARVKTLPMELGRKFPLGFKAINLTQ